MVFDLNIFDYLGEKILRKENINDFKNVYFAGNLDKNKSKFLYSEEMSKLGFNMILFGPNFINDQIKKKDILYKGSFKPEDLARQFHEGFGLIWDGTSIDECNGESGEYLQYNNPHKASLYLSSGLPVIIWRKAALAEFIEKNKVGLLIDSLSDIDKIFDKITKTEYKQLLYNVKRLQERLLSGNYTKEVIKEVEKMYESRILK